MLKPEKKVMGYRVRRTEKPPLFRWADFAAAETASLDYRGGLPEDAAEVRFRILHDDRNIYGMFEVRERGVVARKTNFQDMVCEDSCCEFFFQPAGKDGYFNLEMNANGTFLIYFVRDSRLAPGSGKPADYIALRREDGLLITVKTDLPHYIPEPIMAETVWHLMFAVPAEALEPYCGKIASLNAQVWRGNLYKCADASPYPGWLAWAELDTSSFHAPHCFRNIVLE